MPEYESSVKHLSPLERLIGYLAFPIMLIMVWVGGWPERYLAQVLMLSLLIGAVFCVLVTFWDARREAADKKRHRLAGDELIRIGDNNWFWTSDRDPGDDRVF
ncbi:MAG TPA: hypothetical protein VFL81_00855 [Candidatus Saccharimonadales bacterium]|nr:hypothetical protein [Candidatus Saccharimonadales bacterium]